MSCSPRFRTGEAKDLGFVRETLASLRMNPLFIKTERFLVAEDDDGRIFAFGQVGSSACHSLPIVLMVLCVCFPYECYSHELASLWVEKSFRHRGVGKALAKSLMRQLEETRGLARLYLLCLERTTGFYEKVGFERVPAKEVPWLLRAEFTAGSALFPAASLACMRGAASVTK
ncbi:unnamed protein product [Phaeothamnion confervicola]